MNKNKLLDYESPVTDVLELRFEGMVCTSPQYGVTGGAGGSLGLDDDDYNYGSF